ncbi:MAG: hypothetical protein ACXAEN_16705 [Candidatus Thorarchaeota archaeon]|jgi:hypothetical protein
MSKIYPGYKQVNVSKNVVIENPFDKIEWPKTIVKVRPYVYSTEKDLHNPEADIKIVADLWVVEGCRMDGWKIKIDLDFKQRCLIDVENTEIRDKHGEFVNCPNNEEVIDAIYSTIFGEKKNEQG